MEHMLRECCGTLPRIKVVTYPGTTYEMFVIECPKCEMKTQPHRRLDRAYSEWNHPEDVHLNQGDQGGIDMDFDNHSRLWQKTFHLWRDTVRKRVWLTRGYQPLFMFPKWLVRY